MQTTFPLICRALRRGAAASTVAVLATVSSLCLAQAQTAQPPAAAQSALMPAAPASPTVRLSLAQVYQHLESMGYRDVRDVALRNGLYEARAHNIDGRRVQLHVDGKNGAVLSSRFQF